MKVAATLYLLATYLLFYLTFLDSSSYYFNVCNCEEESIISISRVNLFQHYLNERELILDTVFYEGKLRTEKYFDNITISYWNWELYSVSIDTCHYYYDDGL